MSLATFEKFQRYKQILNENHIDFDPRLVTDHGSYDFETAYRQTAQMLDDDGVKMTAIIAINDFSANGHYRKCPDRERVSYTGRRFCGKLR